MSANSLYFGDNLDILRNEIKSNSVDLVYLDPPFNSKAAYNRLFQSPNGDIPQAQIKAFEDTWHWGEQAEREFAELVRQPNTDVSEMMQALRRFLGENDVMAYLTMMANRLLELHRVLKPTGTLYLHCDPTASHYLKIALDGIFGPANFRNEIIWRRTGSNSAAKRFGPLHQTIFYYVKSDKAPFYPVAAPYTKQYVEEFFKEEDGRGKYQAVALTGPGIRTGESGKAWRAYDPTRAGRHWQPASYVYWKYHQITGDDLVNYSLLERLDKLDDAGLIHWAKKEGGGVPRYRYYIDDAPGVLLQDIWAFQPGTEGCVYKRPNEGIDQDVKWLSTQDKERLGYQTQKPEGLLARIIMASSKEGDVVLDPFCGCGTTVSVAEKLKRNWIGIDITHLAISLVEDRLRAAFPGITFDVHGLPKDLDSARDLAQRDKYEFQYWACSLVKARPYRGKKKGADTGIDGLIPFQDDKTMPKKIIVSVKAGEHVSVPMIRDLAHVVNREKASLGFFVTLTKPTAPMRLEAVKAGYYQSPVGPKPKIQILTVEGLLNGTEQPDYFDLMQGGLMSRKPEREIAEVQLNFDSVITDSSQAEIQEVAQRKGAHVARGGRPVKARKANRKAS